VDGERATTVFDLSAHFWLGELGNVKAEKMPTKVCVGILSSEESLRVWMLARDVIR
jgi:hypothetical protein